MDSKTKQLGLELTAKGRPDSNTLFSVWRSSINGEGVGSNMELIDEAYGTISTELSNHITDALRQLQELRDGIARLREEYTLLASEAIMDDDYAIIYCGDADHIVGHDERVVSDA